MSFEQNESAGQEPETEEVDSTSLLAGWCLADAKTEMPDAPEDEVKKYAHSKAMRFIRDLRIRLQSIAAAL